jgi:hypothetical protein
MEKKSLIFTLFFLTTTFLLGQNKINIIVKKGRVNLSNKVIKAGHIETFKVEDTLKVFTSSLVFVKKNNKIVELATNKKYSYKEILSLFSKSKTSFTEDFVNILMSQKYQIQEKSGSTSRGIDDDWEYLPNDSCIILNNFLKLNINESKNKLTSDIKLFLKGEKDTIILKPSELTKGIKLDKPGEYHWIYTTQKAMCDNNFFILPSDEQQRLKEAFLNFKKSILKFSPEMQEQLIKEYLFEYKLYDL